MKHLPLRFIKIIKQIIVLKGEPIKSIKNDEPLCICFDSIAVQINNIHELDAYGLWTVFDFIVSASKTSILYYENSNKTIPNQRRNYFRAANLKSSLSFDLN